MGADLSAQVDTICDRNLCNAECYCYCSQADSGNLELKCLVLSLLTVKYCCTIVGVVFKIIFLCLECSIVPNPFKKPKFLFFEIIVEFNKVKIIKI